MGGNAFCNFIPVSQSECVCEYCGFADGHANCEKTYRLCQVGPHGKSKPPSIGQKVTKWSAAVAKWRAAGKPTRSDAEVERLYAICSGGDDPDKRCDDFNLRGSCNVCGCRVSRSKHAMINKIRMATEDCPKGRWHENSKIVSFVYPYHAGAAKGNELLYSVRSVAANFLGRADIWIIGDRPAWWKRDDRYLAFAQKSKKVRINTAAKLEVAATTKGISEAFVWMADDINLVRPVSFEWLDTQWYRRKFTREWAQSRPVPNKGSSGWVIDQNRTFRFLARRGKSVDNYMTHMPYVYRKKYLLDAFAHLDVYTRSYVFDLLYFNYYADAKEHRNRKQIVGWEPLYRECGQPQDGTVIRKNIAKAHIVNYCNGSYRYLEQPLKELFSEKCKWEK